MKQFGAIKPHHMFPAGLLAGIGVGASLLVHALAGYGIATIGVLPPRAAHVTDFAAATVLNFSEPDAKPLPQPPELKIQSKPDPKPEPPKPEPPKEEKASEPVPPAVQVIEVPVDTGLDLSKPATTAKAAEPQASKPAATVEPAPAPPSTPPPVQPKQGVASFAGVQAERARRVVYAVDTSGSMTPFLEFVKRELETSVSRLGPDQTFQVVFFHEPVPPEEGQDAPEDPRVRWVGGSDQPHLLKPTPANIASMSALMRTVRAQGRPDPMAGLRAAMSLKPEVVFLLSCRQRFHQGTDEVLQALDELNPRDTRTGRRIAVVKAVTFREDDPTGLMQEIAKEHGDGPESYVVVDRREGTKPSRK